MAHTWVGSGVGSGVGSCSKIKCKYTVTYSRAKKINIPIFDRLNCGLFRQKLTGVGGGVGAGVGARVGTGVGEGVGTGVGFYSVYYIV